MIHFGWRRHNIKPQPFLYDALDQLVAIRNPDGSEVRYAYDAVGNRTQKTTAATTIDYAYGLNCLGVTACVSYHGSRSK